MRKRGYIIGGSVFAVLLLLIFGGFWHLKKDTATYNKHSREYISEKIGQGNNSKLSFSMTHSDPWGDGTRPELVFAQYEGVVVNNNKFDLHDWELTLRFSEPSYIDAMWNGEAEVIDEYTVKVKPLEYDLFIAKNGGTIPVGYVLYSTELQNLDTIEIKGYYLKDYINWKDTKTYFRLKLCVEIWALLVLIYLLICIRLSSNERRRQREEAILIHALDTLVDFIEAKDEYTKGHSRRVATYTRKIAKRLKLPREVIRDYYFTALMHDCGKIGIPDYILKKAESLTDEEYSIIKNHTTIGAGMLNSFTDIKDIAFGALQHHERYDGTGYPNGLKGDEISEIGRIICVADSFDVMNCDRCYRKHISKEEIIKEINNNKGTQFDPTIADVLLEMLEDGSITFD